MPIIQSNGTGGGDWASTATWAGAVVPTGNQNWQIMPGDTVTVSTTVSLGAPSLAGDSLIGTAGGAAATKAKLIVNGSLIWTTAGGTDLQLHGNGVIQVGASGVMGCENALGMWGGQLVLLNPHGGPLANANNFGLEVVGIDHTDEVIVLRNPHYLDLTFNEGNNAVQYGPAGSFGGTFGPGGNLVSETFDTLPNPVVGSRFCGTVVKSVTRSSSTSNFVTADDLASTNFATASFGTTYNPNNQDVNTGFAAFFPMAVPLLNGAPLLDVNNTLGNGANAPVPVTIWSVSQQDGLWQAIVYLPTDMVNFSGLSVATYADDGGGHWVVQTFIYAPGSGGVAAGGGIGPFAITASAVGPYKLSTGRLGPWAIR